MTAEQWVLEKLARADIVPGRGREYDPVIRNSKMFSRVRWLGSLGLGESYMNGDWDCPALDQFFHKLLTSGIADSSFFLPQVFGGVQSWITNQQSYKRAFRIADAHYNLGNDLFQAMLGDSMAYSCSYHPFPEPFQLDRAQYAKFDLIGRKEHLNPGHTFLDIGCGWAGLLRYVSQNFGVSAVGFTVSKEQAAFAKQFCGGLDVQVRLEDYRDCRGRFDRIASVGMFEHVGPKNYRGFLKVVRRILKDDGLFLLHTIGSLSSLKMPDPWINKYIFPGGYLPSLPQLTKAAEGLFVIEDIHNFGQFYDPTLLAWCRNFEAAWPHLKGKYDERFRRMWRYYLLHFAGAFRARHIQVWQIVFSPNGVPGGYKPER